MMQVQVTPNELLQTCNKSALSAVYRKTAGRRTPQTRAGATPAKGEANPATSTKAPTQSALKEWSVACAALAAGQQTVSEAPE